MPGEMIKVVTSKAVLKQLEKAPTEVEDAFFDMVEKVQRMTAPDLARDQGLDFE